MIQLRTKKELEKKAKEEDLDLSSKENYYFAFKKFTAEAKYYCENKKKAS